jgi:hypothetical protein
MESVTFARSFKFYIILTLGLLFYTCLAAGILSTFFNQKKTIAPEQYFLLPFSFFLLFMATYTVRQFFKNVPKLTITKNSIAFNKRIHPIENIKEIQLVGKQPFKYVLNFDVQSAKFTFKDNSTAYFYDFAYRNTPALKSTVNAFLLKNELQDNERYRKISYASISKQSLKNYKGSRFTLYSLGFVLISAYLLFIALSANYAIFYILFFFFSGGIFAICSQTLYYFCLADNYFVVKNKWLPLKKSVYAFSMIKEIIFELEHGRGNPAKCLRVVTKDFKSTLYHAQSFKSKDWMQLIEDLEKTNITLYKEFEF